MVRSDIIRKRALLATGALLAGVALSSCGEPSQNTGAPAPQVQKAQTQTEAATSAAATSGAPPATAPATSRTVSGTRQVPPSTAPPQQAQAERCHTSMLSGTLRPGDAGAGQRYADLTLRNDSASTCTLYGYGGLELVGADGRPLPTNLKRSPNPGPALVRLAPGESAGATLHWSVVPYEGEPVDGPCQPEPATARVIPPDETDPLTVRWDMGPVCGFGSIEGSAYHR